jgi:integrase
MRFPGSTLPEAIKLNKARAKPFKPLNPTTINDKWLSRLRSLLGWCADNEVIPDNPASGIKVDAAKTGERPRVPFTPSDLARIFAPPLFAPGKPLGEFQWALLVALHQGFRASEIAQIRLDSIRHERNVLVFAIEEETKNLASVRLVPVHSTLLRLGLREHISTLRKAGKDRLFPNCQSDLLTVHIPEV